MGDGQQKRVLLVRIGSIGNALVSVPAIRALRRAWPQAHISMVANPLVVELLSRCPYLDELISYDNTGPEKAGPGYARFILGLRRRRFTHAVHFRRYLRSELMGFLSGAPVRVGFATEARVQLVNRKVEYLEGESVIEQNLKLVRALGVDAQDRSLEYWPSEGSEAVQKLIAKTGIDGPLVVMHPGGMTFGERLWDGYGELIAIIRISMGARVVIIGGPAEREVVQKAAESVRPHAVFDADLSLAEHAELIMRADLFAGQNSAPAHLAKSVGTPGAVVYAPQLNVQGEVNKWKPEGCSYLAFTPGLDCLACSMYPCDPESIKRCANSIPPGKVAEALEKLYEEEKKNKLEKGGSHGGDPG